MVELSYLHGDEMSKDSVSTDWNSLPSWHASDTVSFKTLLDRQLLERFKIFTSVIYHIAN